jgi:hypothetical protein
MMPSAPVEEQQVDGGVDVAPHRRWGSGHSPSALRRARLSLVKEAAQLGDVNNPIRSGVDSIPSFAAAQ